MFEVSEKYLSIPKDLEHVSIKSFHRLIITSKDLLFYGAEIQGIRDLLIVFSISKIPRSGVLIQYPQHLSETQMTPTNVNLLFLWGEVQKWSCQCLSGRIYKGIQNLAEMHEYIWEASIIS